MRHPPRTSSRRRACVVVVVAIAACYARPDTLGDPCRADEDCNDAQVCRDRICRPAPDDPAPAAESGTAGGTSTATAGGTGPAASSGGEAEAAPHTPRAHAGATRIGAAGSASAALQR